jgi:hypothetical protein
LDYFHSAAEVLAAGSGNDHPTANLAFAKAVMVYFAIVGFLMGYLVTRLFLARGLRLVDQSTVEELKKRVNEVQQQLPKVRESVAKGGPARGGPDDAEAGETEPPQPDGPDAHHEG